MLSDPRLSNQKTATQHRSQRSFSNLVTTKLSIILNLKTQAATRIPTDCRVSLIADDPSALTVSTPQNFTVDIHFLLKETDSQESSSSPGHRQHARSASVPAANLVPESPSDAASSSVAGGKRSMSPHPDESPAKRQSTWSAEEDVILIQLRGKGMKWEDISTRIPGRSHMSCRLHYQNYLERRYPWTDERKDKLARLYERFKAEMWAKVAEELVIPWRAVEAMHWRLGEHEMAHRAGVVPFSSSIPAADGVLSPENPASPARGHSHSQSLSSSRYNRPASSHGGSTNINSRSSAGVSTRSIVARRDNAPRLAPPQSPEEYRQFAPMGSGMPMGPGRGGPMLPSVAEMTTGVSPYSTPAYAMPMAPAGGYAAPGQLLPAIGTLGMPPIKEMRGLASPEMSHIPGMGQRETSRRRQ